METSAKVHKYADKAICKQKKVASVGRIIDDSTAVRETLNFKDDNSPILYTKVLAEVKRIKSQIPPRRRSLQVHTSRSEKDTGPFYYQEGSLG